MGAAAGCTELTGHDCSADAEGQRELGAAGTEVQNLPLAEVG